MTGWKYYQSYRTKFKATAVSGLILHGKLVYDAFIKDKVDLIQSREIGLFLFLESSPCMFTFVECVPPAIRLWNCLRNSSQWRRYERHQKIASIYQQNAID